MPTPTYDDYLDALDRMYDGKTEFDIDAWSEFIGSWTALVASVDFSSTLEWELSQVRDGVDELFRGPIRLEIHRRMGLSRDRVREAQLLISELGDLNQEELDYLDQYASFIGRGKAVAGPIAGKSRT